jgi:hypothetical protein
MRGGRTARANHAMASGGAPLTGNDDVVNTYEITKQLESGAFIPIPWTLGDFTFHSPGDGEFGVRATGTLAAADWRTALYEFGARLRSLMGAIAVEELVALSSYGGSLVITRNNSRYAYLSWSRGEKEPVTVALVGEERGKQIEEAAVQLANNDSTNAAAHYREFLLYGSMLVKAVHLLRAAEALAGTISVQTKCQNCSELVECRNCQQATTVPRTDEVKLKEIMGKTSYKYFYRTPGVRHDLMHGRYVDQLAMKEHLEPLEKGVQNTLRSRLSFSEKPPRRRAAGLYAYRVRRMLLETDTSFPPLVELIRILESNMSFEGDPRLVSGDQSQRILSTF